MRLLSLRLLAMATASVVTLLLPGTGYAGNVFLTGHDPDFHSQPGAGNGDKLLATGLSFVTGGTYNDGAATAKKFLWVESTIPVPGGHLRGENSLDDVGVFAIDYDRVDGTGFAAANLSNYTAIAIASSFGGTLTRAELDALIARKTDIAAFINSGGGLFASSECYPCGANLLGGSTAPDLFGYLPISVTSIGASPPFTVTAYGASLGLLNSDMNDPTHNSFGLTGGLNIVDTDSSGNATTLAGTVQVTTTGFNQVPEPGSLALAVLALGALVRPRRQTRPRMTTIHHD